MAGGHNRKENPVNQRGSRRRSAPRVISAGRAGDQPDLPERQRGWPDQTLEWWAHWGDSPLSDDFTEGDWDELTTAALFHALVWDDTTPVTTRMKAGAELRQRTAKFGATPEDRARLRIQYVFADEAEARSASRPSSRSRRAPLRAVDDA